MIAMTFKKNTGFTLIELMITVAIVAILAAVAYPSYTQYVARGKRAECRSGILQALQQQERYFSQKNTYVEVTAAATAPVIRNFSGDNKAASACTIVSATCPAVGGTTPGLTTCVEVQGNLTNDPKNITMIYADSLGNKGCKVGTTRTTTESACWK